VLCWVLSGRGLCDELITRPEESYRLLHRCVRSINLKNEEAMASVWLQRNKKMEMYLRVNLLGPNPRLMEKEFTGPRSHKL